ncbi:hypothetical protein HanXRQr2_Chr12g0527521 [Helianthus annuus]|uniref:Leucine-rich repeat domain, L domain-like protein n=1 Tax=Helianthus annuus TaxID=4232 RepID=A0A9K3HEP8_HELAN|nr:hypothetical protein HanXRQr2_Chr12g0527521 [Helianthus annuus]KAJ0861582.1 hypothetical protein HanPSC8_Chr12g0508331 [Helianthus annuus]
MSIFTTLLLSVTFVINIPQGVIRTYGGSWVWDLSAQDAAAEVSFCAVCSGTVAADPPSNGCHLYSLGGSVMLRGYRGLNNFRPFTLERLVKPCDVYDLRTLRFVSLGSSSGLGLLQRFLLRNNFARRLFHRLLNVLLSRPKRLDNKLGFLRFWLFGLL